MANNVYAHLVYGFPVLTDEGEEFADAEHEPPVWLRDPTDENKLLSLEEIVARLEGIVSPTVEFDESNPQVLEKYQAYWDAKRKAEERSGIALVQHCRAEHTMYILGISESDHNPWRGEAERLGQRIEAKPDWREMLKSFCERARIPFSEPEWLLAPFSE